MTKPVEWYEDSIRHELSLCKTLGEKRMVLHAFLAGAENALSIAYFFKDLIPHGKDLNEGKKDLFDALEKIQVEVERERFVDDLYDPIPVYEETENGKADSRCCGNCDYYGGKITMGTSCSHCWRYDRPVCAVIEVFQENPNIFSPWVVHRNLFQI